MQDENSNLVDGIISTLKLFHPEGLVQIFAIDQQSNKKFFGVFSDFTKAAEVAAKFNGKFNIFMSLNAFNAWPEVEINPEKLRVPGKNRMLKTEDVSQISWFLVDIDPDRNCKERCVSATEAEVTEAKVVAKKIIADFKARGFPKPIVCFSGNGYHLLWKTSLDADDENQNLIKRALISLAAAHNSEHAHVDSMIFNRAHLTKLYVTTACKGSNTCDRPWRPSRIVSVPEKIQILSEEQLQQIADKAPEDNVEISDVCDRASSTSSKKLKEKIKEVFEETCNEAEIFLGQDDGLEYISLNASHPGPRNYLISSRAFADRLVFEFYKKFGEAVTPSNFSFQIAHLAALTRVTGESKPIFKRIAKVGDCIYYALNDQQCQFVKITKDDVKLLQASDFTEDDPKIICTEIMAPQVLPQIVTAASFEALIAKYLNLESKDDLVLLITSIISWLWVDQERIIIVLQGPAGSSKSWTTNIIKKIIDTSKTKARAIPNTVRDLSVDLSNKFVSDYDNLSEKSISSEISDALCQACYGGSLSLRKLCTDGETYTISFSSAIILNGIGSFISKPDLADRIVVIHTKAIDKAHRKKKSEMEKTLEGDMPLLLGAMFEIARKTLNVLPTIHLSELARMADYQTLGAAIAKVIWGDEKIFLDAFASNQVNTLDDLVAENILAATIKIFADEMVDDVTLVKPSDFYNSLVEIAETEGTDVKSGNFPKNASRLMKELNLLTTALAAVGVEAKRLKTNGVRYAQIARRYPKPLVSARASTEGYRVISKHYSGDKLFEVKEKIAPRKTGVVES